VSPRDLVYPEGWAYTKGCFHNKHNSITGLYEEVMTIIIYGGKSVKKKYIVILLIICIVIMLTYKIIAGNIVRDKTYDYLETKGYEQEDISNIEIKHSFLNKLLSYNEWRIFVEFKSEPNIIFAFTYRNKEILKQGVTSTPMLDKNEILDYSNKFNNGEFKK